MVAAHSAAGAYIALKFPLCCGAASRRSFLHFDLQLVRVSMLGKLFGIAAGAVRSCAWIGSMPTTRSGVRRFHLPTMLAMLSAPAIPVIAAIEWSSEA
jgi:hypothetical protein